MNTCKAHKAGDIIKLADIDFVILEDLGPFSGDGESHDLFILALEGQGKGRFSGGTNNYAKSELKSQVEDWLYRLTEKMAEQGLDADLIRSRAISLTTLDGYKGFGNIEVMAAPLTLDEARRCAELMPDLDEACWLATGWSGPEHFGSECSLIIYPEGYLNGHYCFNTFSILPALVISSELLEESRLQTEGGK